MRRLRAQLERVTAEALKLSGGWVVWRQSPDGADRFTSPSAPGEAVTRAELVARREAPGVTRIVVRRGAPEPDDESGHARRLARNI